MSNDKLKMTNEGVPSARYCNNVAKRLIHLTFDIGHLTLIALAICLLSFVVFPLPVQAELVELGIDPLRIELGSRPLGMGGAFAGLADDANAALYNPGGMAWTKGISFTGQDSENIVAIQAYPTGNNSSFGLAVISKTLLNVPIPTGVAKSTSSVLYLSYGTKLNFIPFFARYPVFQHLGFGANIKVLAGQTLQRTALFDRSATGWEMDLGVLWKAKDWLSAGLTLQNIVPKGTLGGGEIRWDVGGTEGVTAVAKIGASARVIGDIGSPIFMEGRQLLLSGELNLSRDRPMLLRVGGELGFNKRFFVRTGYMQQYVANGSSSDLNFGLGYRNEQWGIDFSTYREPLSNQRYACFSILYFPADWIVLRQLDLEKPKMMVERPIEAISLEDNIVTYDDKLEVFGRVKPGVKVYINGLPASLAPDNSFKTTVSLRMQKNLILVEAHYGGEKKTWKYKVLRKARVKVADKKKVQNLAKKKESVETLVTIGVVEIAPEADFVMEAGVTRGELSSWLVKAADIKLPEVKQDLFADVPKGHSLAPYIKVIVDLGLLRPFPDGTFRPGAFVSKQEGDVIFARFGVKQ